MRLAAEVRAFQELRSPSLRLPLPFYVVTDGAFALTPTEILLALRKAAETRPDVLEIQSGSARAGEPSIEISDSEVNINLANVTGATLHVDHTYEAGDFGEQLAIDAMVLAALAFENIGQADLASRLAPSFLAQCSFLSSVEVPWALQAAMARSRRIREALALANALDESGDVAARQASILFTLPALYHGHSLDEREASEHISTLRNRIAKRREDGDLQSAAAECVNLANLLRARGDPSEALTLYEEAAELDPDYLDRAHFWFEKGGVLWFSGRFKAGADAYAKALSLGAEPLALALQADCLMFAGEYESARALFAQFNRDHESSGDEYHLSEYRLKELVLDMIVDDLGIKTQKRRTEEAVNVGSWHRSPSPEDQIKVAVRQLQRDALWGSAWLNLGLANLEQEKMREALTNFIASTFWLPADLETWQNAIVIAMALDDTSLLSAILTTGRRQAGQPLMDHLVIWAKEQGAEFPREQFLSEVDAVLARHPPRPPSGFTMRFLAEDGTVESIEIFDHRRE